MALVVGLCGRFQFRNSCQKPYDLGLKLGDSGIGHLFTFCELVHFGHPFQFRASQSAAICSWVAAVGPVAPHVSQSSDIGVCVPSSATCVIWHSFTPLHQGQGSLPVTLNICICWAAFWDINSLIYPVLPVFLFDQQAFVLMTTTPVAVDVRRPTAEGCGIS